MGWMDGCTNGWVVWTARACGRGAQEQAPAMCVCKRAPCWAPGPGCGRVWSLVHVFLLFCAVMVWVWVRGAYKAPFVGGRRWQGGLIMSCVCAAPRKQRKMPSC